MLFGGNLVRVYVDKEVGGGGGGGELAGPGEKGTQTTCRVWQGNDAYREDCERLSAAEVSLISDVHALYF